MNDDKRRVILGAVMTLCLLVALCTPAPVSADNIRAFALSTSAPDLVVDFTSLVPETPSIGEMVTFKVDIANQGNSDAGPFRVDFYIGRK